MHGRNDDRPEEGKADLPSVRVAADEQVETPAVQQIDDVQVTQMIQGLGSERAEALLKQNLPLDGSPEIQLSPAWWPWMPIVPFRISVVVE